MRFLSILCLSLIATVAHGQSDPNKWPSLVTSNTLELKILDPLPASGADALPLVIYLKNLAATRVGAEADNIILRDLRASGYLVAVLDYANHPRARVPFLNRDLGKLRDDLRAKKILSQFK